MAETAAKRNYKIYLIITAALLMGAVYLLFDPAETEWMPKCPVHTLTGFDCPGCGTQRALHALLHGDLAATFRANALLVLFIPLITVMGISELNRSRWPRLYKFMVSPVTIYSLLGIVAVWTIVRNIIY